MSDDNVQTDNNSDNIVTLEDDSEYEDGAELTQFNGTVIIIHYKNRRDDEPYHTIHCCSKTDLNINQLIAQFASTSTDIIQTIEVREYSSLWIPLN